MKPLSFCSIFLLFCAFSIERNNAAGFDQKLLKDYTKEELDVLEDAVKRQGQRFLSEFEASVDCEELQCNMCLGFELAKVPHEICLNFGIIRDKLGAFIEFTYDSDEIWREEVKFDTLCTGLPKPLNKVGICLEAYNVSLIGLPQEAAVCLRTELTLIFPLLSIDFNCLKYEKGKGIFFDWNIESESKALIDININGGKPIVSFNSPIPWELVQPILNAIQVQRQKLVELQHELTQQIKENIKEGNWWDAFINSIAAGGTMGMGIS